MTEGEQGLARFALTADDAKRMMEELRQHPEWADMTLQELREHFERSYPKQEGPHG